MKIDTANMETVLMRMYNVRSHIMIPNISWGIAGLHECDILILNKSSYATEIEIKISKADLLKDKLKKHGHRHNHIKYLYFAVPESLKELALTEIPERAGLIVINDEIYFERSRKKSFWASKIIRNPIPNKNAHKWDNSERMKLAELGCMRIPNLLEARLSMKNTIKELRSDKNNK